MATYKKKKAKAVSKCPYCGATLQMVPAAQMGFEVLAEHGPEFYWRCSNTKACDAYIAADPKTKKPNGRIANDRLRRGRMIIHKWQQILEDAGMMSADTFRETYIGGELGMSKGCMSHIRDISDAQCERILKRLEEVYHTEPKVAELIEKAKYSLAWRHVHGVAYEKGAYFGEDGAVTEAPEWFIDGRERYQPYVSGVKNAKDKNLQNRLSRKNTRADYEAAASKELTENDGES